MSGSFYTGGSNVARDEVVHNVRKVPMSPYGDIDAVLTFRLH